MEEKARSAQDQEQWLLSQERDLKANQAAKEKRDRAYSVMAEYKRLDYDVCLADDSTQAVEDLYEFFASTGITEEVFIV